MISCSSDDAGRILTISYSQRVEPGQVEECLEAVRGMDHLQPGFVLLSDLTNLESMDAECAESLGALMEECSLKGMGAVVRVIPDPSKDIGFNLITLFHCAKPIKTHTRPNLAEAMKCLLMEYPVLDEAA
jgi:hypothetical protein